MCSTRILHRAALIGLTGASIACGGESLSPDGAVASITISPSTPTLNVGAQLPLVATLKDAQGNTLTGPKIFWTSSDTTIATVSDAGIVTAVALGTAQIAASSQGTPGIATVTVAPTPVASVVIVPENATASVGSTVQLQAVTYDAQGNVLTGRTVVWSSDHQSVATVDDAGHVTAVAAGQATIAATSEGQSGTSAVTVKPVEVASVSISPSTASVDVNKSVQLGATVRDKDGGKLDGRAVSWSSSNDKVATVDGSGKVTGVAAGNVTITATSEGKSGTAAVSVNAPGPPPVSEAAVKMVDVSPSSKTINVGETVQLHVTLKDADGRTLTGRTVVWTSSDNSNAIVSSTGLVLGISRGDATITATSEGKSGSAKIKVEREVHDVTVGLAKSELEIGQTTQATATLYASDGAVLTDRPVTWLSSNGAVASISSSGTVQALTPGLATITATSEGQDGAANLTVKGGGDQSGGSTGPGDSGGDGKKKGKGHGKPHGHG